MSLYEVMSMSIALEKMNRGGNDGTMPDEEFDALKDAVRSMNLPDVVLH